MLERPCIFVVRFSKVCLSELVTTSASIDPCPVTVINEFVFKVGAATEEVQWGDAEIGLPC